DSLAHPVQPHPGTFLTDPTHWFLRFQGELYACGFISFIDAQGNGNNALARLNEQTQRWEALECTNPMASGIGALVRKVPQGSNLYATGDWPGSLCGYPESCVFRYDGEAFHIWEPFQQIPQDNGNYVGY